MMLLPVFSRLFLAAALIGPSATSIATDAPPRLADLAPADALAEARKVTRIGQYGATRVMQLQIKAGGELSAHTAPERVLVIVLSGRGHFDFDGERIALHERQVLHMEPDEMHGVTADTDLDLLLVRIDERTTIP